MPRPTSRKNLLALLVGVALACGEGPSEVSTGNLLVTVSGLPAGSSADLVVSGPNGYSQAVSASQTLTSLAAGTYTVAANSVTVGSAVYSGTPASQTVSVGGSTATASVAYSTGAGSLNVTINGLGTSGDAAVTVTGPNSYSQGISATQTLTNLIPGTYTVAAQNVVATGGTPHSPSPASQNVTVTATGTATAVVSYAPPTSGALNLGIAGLYLTQSAQSWDGSVPLVRNRNGYLRVFPVASRANTEVPVMRVRVFDASNILDTTILIPAPRASVPTAVDESSLQNSWNTRIPGSLIQPGFRFEADVDPANLVEEIDETDNSSAPPAPVVETVPTLNVTFVPVVQSNGLTGDVTNATSDAFLASIQKMHPIANYNAIVRAPLVLTDVGVTDTLESDNGNAAWGTVLHQIELLRVELGSSRYHYGVAKVSYASGVAGVAYVSNGFGERAALGWDYLPSGAAVAAHELGHNWGRNHAPCGGPGGVDDGFPFPDGRIGLYGLDVAAASLKPASTSDIMGYCDPKWIGAYTYKAVMSYLVSPPFPVASALPSQMAQPCLMVWGRVRNGELVLEPSFQATTQPRLPRSPGSFTVEGRTEDGASVFDLSFDPSEIADASSSGGDAAFVFAVPISDAQAGRLASLRLSGRGSQTVRSRAPSAVRPQVRQQRTMQPAQVRRVAGGKIAVKWDATAHPMVVVRDPHTREILSFARGGRVQVASRSGELELVLSDGVRSIVRRVPVTR